MLEPCSSDGGHGTRNGMGGRLFQFTHLETKAWGNIPRTFDSRESLFERLSCTGHPENHKTVYFPTYNKKRRCREQRKSSHSPGDHMGPHTNNRLCLYQGVFLFPRTAIYLPSAPQGIVSCCSGQNLSYLLVYSGRVLRLGHTKSDWLIKYQMSKFIQSGQTLVFSWHLHELTPEKCLSFLGP